MTRLILTLSALALTGCATMQGRFDESTSTLVAACRGIVLAPEANADVVNACKRIIALDDAIGTGLRS